MISIVIPIYNQERFIGATLESILNQTYQDFEVILIDDGSTDTTPMICKAYCERDSRFSYYRQDNQGPSAARHNGIQRSSGTHLCLFDGDDLMAPERLQKQIEVFQKDPTIDILYTALKLINEKGEEIGEIRGQDYPPQDFLVYMLFRNMIPALSTTMVKRECLIAHNFDFSLRNAEDYEFMLRLAQHYRFQYLDIPLTFYRRHQKNLSNDLSAHRQAELKILNRYEESFVDQAIAKSNLSSDVKLMMKGKILFNQEKWQAALDTFQGLYSALSFFYGGVCSFKLSRFDEAMVSFEDSLKLDPTNPACHNNLGVVYYFKGRFSEASEQFEMALELKSGYMDAQMNLMLKNKETPKLTLKELRPDIMPYQKFS